MTITAPTNTNAKVTINKGDEVRFFWKGTLTKVVVEADFEATIVGWNEKGTATIEYNNSPNGRAWVTVK
jgi:plastocyanin